MYDDAFLGLIGLTPADFYRYRDCRKTEFNELEIETRGGGANAVCDACRDCHDNFHGDTCVVAIQAKLRKHPLYLREELNSGDIGYLTFYFTLEQSNHAD